MADSRIPPPDIDGVLRAICIASSDAWFFAPSEHDAITHCSQEFLKLLHIDGPVPSESGKSIDLDDKRIIEGCKRIGLPTDALLRATSANSDESDSLIVNYSAGRWTITVKHVMDGNGNKTGNLVFFRSNETHAGFHSVLQRAEEARKNLSVLSSRETEILNLVCSGLTNKAVARKASISEKTVEKHRANIMRKLELRSVADLIRCVTEASLLSDR